MFPDLTKLTTFLVENNITIKQFYLLWCHYLDELQDPNATRTRFVKSPNPKNRAIANIYRYGRHDPWTKEEITDLEKKEFIKIIDKKYGYIPDNIEITPRARRIIFTSLASFEELWLAYPPFMTINGKKIPIRTEKDKCEELYLKRIKFIFDHDKAMIATNYAVEHDMVNQSFLKYLDGDLWRSIYDNIMPDEKDKVEIGYSNIEDADLN